MRLLLVVLILLAASGCATNATLLIYSQPTGAYITEIGTGTAFGIAPARVAFAKESLTPTKDAAGCYHIHGYEARWVSGARALSHNPILLCNGPTDAYQIVIPRNAADAGLEKDLQFAMQVEAMIAQQRQAEAAEFSAAAALSNAFRAAQQRPSPSVNCTTRPSLDGRSVQTSCQ